MGIFLISITLIGIGVISYLINTYTNKYVNENLITILIIGGITGTLFTFFIFLNQNVEHSKAIDNYKILQEEISLYESSDSCGIHYTINLENRVKTMNDDIETNKKYCDSFLFGWFNSKEVGNLKPIEFNLKK